MDQDGFVVEVHHEISPELDAELDAFYGKQVSPELLCRQDISRVRYDRSWVNINGGNFLVTARTQAGQLVASFFVRNGGQILLPAIDPRFDIVRAFAHMIAVSYDESDEEIWAQTDNRMLADMVARTGLADVSEEGRITWRR